jgi:predicted lipoprotein with Yx(FWY)xxD motif
MTVYVFDADKGSSSSCSGACAAKWPPLTTSGTPRAGSGAQASALGTITRSDGTKQVTYAGHPLYYFVKDKDDGDAYGQGVNAFGASWYAVKPTGEKLDNS